ncbi:ComEC/Rec2 family competence protein [Adhaeretor mobilis]|uniref:ComEC family competence protein n=1 Tax=Adhaeretor mobilis TaxID=1930276 RepID=A0A517MYY1_9BACT|nr:ComEC/Rec2 family competence protein [Adhaeretor mobilis]QDT00096.1 ComEC family competence protein [Adhaeretor mobilis]
MPAPQDIAARRRYCPLLAVAAAFLTGILGDRSFGALSLSIWLLTCVVALALAWRYRRAEGFCNAAVLTLVATLCLGGAYADLRWNYFAANDLGRYAPEQPQPICCEAVLTSPVTHRPRPQHDPLRALPAGPSSQTTVRILRLRNGRTWQDVSGECRLRVAGKLPKLVPGQRLKIYGRFARPTPALNPGQRDWAERDRGAGHLAELYSSRVECVFAAGSLTSPSLVDRLRDACEQHLERYINDEQRPLAAALLLGDRGQLDDDSTEAFFQTGVIHLLVISGLHVGMAAAIFLGIARLLRLPWNASLLVAAIAVVTYAAVTGMRPPVIRACLMTLLGLIALASARPVSLTNLVAAAALGVALVNPSELFLPGTLLSFLTVTGLLGYGRWLSRKQRDPLVDLIAKFESWPKKLLRWGRTRTCQIVVASGVAWVTAAPLVAYAFHLSTPSGIIVTPLLWPLVAIGLAMGLGVMLLGWIPPLAYLMGWVCGICLSWIRGIVDLAHSLEFGSFYCAGPQVWWLVGLYGGLAAIAWVGLRPTRWRWYASALVGWTAVGLLFASFSRLNDGELRCTFLAMGHGTCAVVELPGGQTLLYDAGSLNSPEYAGRTIAEFLWSRGITSIDAMVLSHADVDHYNAVPGLLERFPIGVVYITPLMFDPIATQGRLTAPEYLREILAQEKIPLREIWMNDRLDVVDDDVTIEVLHPPRTGVIGRDNANSLTLLVGYQGKRILLPGDLEEAGIEAVTAERAEDVDILLAPHHGSAGSDPPGFAAWCTPEFVAVSGRSPTRTTLANRSYREAGAKVLHTSNRGAVEFTLSASDLMVRTFRN